MSQGEFLMSLASIYARAATRPPWKAWARAGAAVHLLAPGGSTPLPDLETPGPDGSAVVTPLWAVRVDRPAGGRAFYVTRAPLATEASPR